MTLTLLYFAGSSKHTPYHAPGETRLLAYGNGDDILDFLEYSLLDDAGNVSLTVIDYDATGQADLRIDFENGSSEIWHDGRWFTVGTRDGVRGIQYDGGFLVVENRDNRPVVVSK